MKKYYKYLGCLILITVLAFGFSSCIKDDYKALGEAGTPSVKLGEAPENVLYMSPFSDSRVIDLGTVRRDEVRKSDVEKTYTVTIINVEDSIDAYNDANDTHYSVIPDSIYTLVTGKGVESTGSGTYKITFAPGVTAVPISILVNGAKWDLSQSYAFYFKITEPSGKQITADHEELLAVIAIKNEYDGVYSIKSGDILRYTNPTTVEDPSTLNGTIAGNPDLVLSTINLTTVEIANLTWFGGTSGVAGINNLQATVDPVTNLVTMKALGNGTLRNIEGEVNEYDPDTQTFTLNFEWNPTANKRTVTNLVISYKGAR